VNPPHDVVVELRSTGEEGGFCGAVEEGEKPKSSLSKKVSHDAISRRREAQRERNRSRNQGKKNKSFLKVVRKGSTRTKENQDKGRSENGRAGNEVTGRGPEGNIEESLRLNRPGERREEEHILQFSIKRLGFSKTRDLLPSE